MSKVVITTITSGYGSAARLNANFTALATALENTLSRDGTAPNAMEADLDLNSNHIINLGAPQNASDAVRLLDLQAASVATPLPSQGGNNGKVLMTDGSAVSWQSVASFPPLVSNAGKVLMTDGSSVAWVSIASQLGTDLTAAADKLAYFTSASALALTTFTAFGRSLVDDADAATARATLGLGTIATAAAPAGTVVGTTDAQVLTNKTFTNPSNTKQTLTIAATINWDCDLGGIAEATLNQVGHTMAAPTHPVVGVYLLVLNQDGTGSRTITTWNAVFKFPGGVAPTLSTGAGKKDIAAFYYDGTQFNNTGIALDVR